MKRKQHFDIGVLIAKDAKGRFRASLEAGGKDGAPLVPVEILRCLGFDATGKASRSIARDSYATYKQKVVDFFAKDGHPSIQLQRMHEPTPLPGVGSCKWLLLSITADLDMEIPAEEMFQFSEEFTHGDMTHWGAGDFYARVEPEIVAALESGKPFDTGWRGCKKEILSSRLSCDGATVFCEASVSDDFDTSGSGKIDVIVPTTLKQVQAALSKAATLAEKERDANADYTGFSIHRGDADGPWEETYIARRSDMALLYMDQPPGDEYHQWGFQDTVDDIPTETKEALEEYITRHQFDEVFAPFSHDGWTVTRWE